MVVDRLTVSCPNWAIAMARERPIGVFTDGARSFTLLDGKLNFKVYEKTRAISGNGMAIALLAGTYFRCR